MKIKYQLLICLSCIFITLAFFHFKSQSQPKNEALTGYIFMDKGIYNMYLLLKDSGKEIQLEFIQDEESELYFVNGDYVRVEGTFLCSGNIFVIDRIEGIETNFDWVTE